MHEDIRLPYGSGPLYPNQDAQREEYDEPSVFDMLCAVVFVIVLFAIFSVFVPALKIYGENIDMTYKEALAYRLRN